MTDKIIHYCWFGKKPLTKSAKKCIKSWKKYMPDYKIKRWDESNYDVNKIPYTQEAYKLKMWAFVSDYARFDIIYHYGGIYFDTDVELLKPIEDLIKRGPIMAIESGSISDLLNRRKWHVFINPGLILYGDSNMYIYRRILEQYENKHFFINNTIDTTTVVNSLTNLILNCSIAKINDCAFCEGVYIYPQEYFNPYGDNFLISKLKITENTRSIHHYDASWLSNKTKRVEKWKQKMIKKERKIGPQRYTKYKAKLFLKIKKELYLNGVVGLLKKIMKKIYN